uniref:BTAD domain-containing putative transcriptional regulator n=1 Tax=Nonomuraea bangladeshensis TaxID=404385 RepID=UPI003F49960A
MQVWAADGELVPVPETKVRALLADLLAHREQPVSSSRLIDDLWGDNLPANPANTLQIKISRLRHTLEQAEAGADELVASGPPGYTLKGRIDADEFAELVAQAREINNPRAKADVLTKALDLWRGPAFADFAYEDFVRPAANRLEEQRLAALEMRAEARLELGDHLTVIGEFSDLVERHPLRESLRAIYMRALYRAGRQSDALASYAQLREHLANELGLDPSPALTAVHQAILQQDGALIPQPATAPGRTNLPLSATRLVGREGVVDELRALLSERRLVTLTGPGGVGKTRLATETAGRSIQDFPEGAWLVDLAARFRHTTSPDVTMLARAVASVLGLRDDALPGEASSAVEVLTRSSRVRRTLLVLDGCEHIIDSVAKLAELLLKAVPELRILATSREPLALAGESVWQVPPLALPDPSASAQDLAEVGAVRLFLDRVTALMPGFTLETSNAPRVVELCRRLDGIPLALELAATRVPALGVRELVARLDRRFHVLVAGRRDAPERQRTLQAVIDWSWDLLTDLERVVLRRLAVHVDGCTITAAEATCAGDEIASETIVSILARLVDRSLVVMTETPYGPRYRLLESVSEYCRQRLAETGEFEHVQRSVWRYYLRLAEEAREHLYGHEQREWLDLLDSESVNLSDALHGMTQQGDAAAIELAGALTWYWFLRGRLGDARDFLDGALAVDGGAPAGLHAVGTVWQNSLHLLTDGKAGHEERTRAVEQALEEIDDLRERARAQWLYGYALYISLSDLATSESLTRRALDTFKEMDDPWGTAAALSTAAHHAMVHGDLGAIEHYGEQSLQGFHELGDQWGQLQTICPLVYRAEALGDYDSAIRLNSEALSVAEDLRFWFDVYDRTVCLGRLALLRNDLPRARQLHERARRLAAEQRYKVGEYHYELGLALIECREGTLHLAQERLDRLLGWHRAAAFAHGSPLFLAELAFLAERRGDTETAVTRLVESLAAAQATNDHRGIARALERLANVQIMLNHQDRGARLLGAADAARRSAGVPPSEADQADLRRIAAQARSSLGKDGFAAEFQCGAELDLDDCVSLLTLSDDGHVTIGPV